MIFWSSQRVVVTGGGGFLGSFVVEKLRAAGCPYVFSVRSRDYDLLARSQIARLFDDTHPSTVIHLAGVVGGIEANRQHPGRFFYENAIMGIELIEQARQYGVQKLVVVGTICAYPKFAAVPFKETDLWNGLPEETNAPYGIAKKALLTQCQAYRQEYGFNSIYLLPVNLYGPRDNFDTTTSHVIPAMIRKCVEARRKRAQHVECWGTGRPTREFLYVEDAAEAVVLAAEHYDGPEPVNLGVGQEVLVCDLAAMIARLTGFTGEIRWNTSYPDGQMRRSLDTSRAEKSFGFVARTPLEDGLRRTITWYDRSEASLTDYEGGD